MDSKSFKTVGNNKDCYISALILPHGGVRPFHQKSTCSTQLTLRTCVMQSHPNYARMSKPTKPSNSTVWLVKIALRSKSYYRFSKIEPISHETASAFVVLLAWIYGVLNMSLISYRDGRTNFLCIKWHDSHFPDWPERTEPLPWLISDHCINSPSGQIETAQFPNWLATPE